MALRNLLFSLFLAFAHLTTAQQPLYAQCGGQGWTGSTSCALGLQCAAQNAWFSQCVPSSSSDGTVTITLPGGTSFVTASTTRTVTFYPPCPTYSQIVTTTTVCPTATPRV